MSNSIYCSEHHPNFCETRNVIHHELAKLVTDSKMYFEARNLSENAEYYPDKRIKTEKTSCEIPKLYLTLFCFVVL